MYRSTALSAAGFGGAWGPLDGGTLIPFKIWLSPQYKSIKSLIKHYLLASFCKQYHSIPLLCFYTIASSARSPAEE